MKIFFRLLLAHLLADYTLQTNYIANWKKKNFLGVLVHAGIFYILGMYLTWDELNNIWFDYPVSLSGWWCMLILFILHAIEDEYRAHNVRVGNAQDNILFYFWDQLIHIVFLFMFSPIKSFYFEPEIIILCIIILGTHFTSVVTLYIESLIYNTQVAYYNFATKYHYIILRLITMLLFFLPGKWYLVSLLMVPVFFVVYNKVRHITKIGLVFNFFVTYLLGYTILLVLGRV